MGKYIQDSVQEIKDKLSEVEDANKKADAKKQAVVIRAETSSGSPNARLLQVIEAHDDYIVVRGRKETQPERFSFSGVTNWRFAEYNEKEWL